MRTWSYVVKVVYEDVVIRSEGGLRGRGHTLVNVFFTFTKNELISGSAAAQSARPCLALDGWRRTRRQQKNEPPAADESLLTAVTLHRPHQDYQV